MSGLGDYEAVEDDDDESSGVEPDADSDAGLCVEEFIGTEFECKQISYAYFKLVSYDSSNSGMIHPSREFHGHCMLADGGHPFQHTSPTFAPPTHLWHGPRAMDRLLSPISALESLKQDVRLSCLG